jgi:hypothetical protein
VVDAQIVEMVVAAVSKSCELLLSQGAKITGYALCTDDGLWTVYHVASSLPLGGSKPYWANPVEWSVVAREAKPVFARISNSLRAGAQEASKNGTFGKHVDTMFESLVTALDQMRPTISRLTVADSDLLLLVSSTDPSPKLLGMEVEAARRLNSPKLFADWHALIHA